MERLTVNTWIEQLARLTQSGAKAVLVTVARTRGSTPRAPGAHMIVGTEACHGSVGGGQLEHRAVEHARSLLAEASPFASLVRFPLGASVGQCCGGVVELVFEPITAGGADWISAARALTAAGRPWGRRVPLGKGETRVFDADSVSSVFDLAAQTERARSLLAGADSSAALARGKHAGDTDTLDDKAPSDASPTDLCLIDVCLPPELQVLLFGAGHVGRALAEVLGRLPMQVRWIDARADAFPTAIAPNIEAICTDTPATEVRKAPADGIFLVLTHSHALDFELVKAILERGDFRLCGLLGSQGKRARFEQRLRARGLPEHAITRLHCPIGVPEIASKEPEVIAIAVAAELLQLRGTSVLHRLSQ
jgi:xanthine dehydrogenase accessory factor